MDKRTEERTDGRPAGKERKTKYDYSLYIVTDRACMSAAALGEAVEHAIAGGCTMVQLRENGIRDREFYELAEEIKGITDTYGIPLIINNRLDIALAVKAAGVHIGQKDIPLSAVRRSAGPDMLIGVSVTSPEEARQAQRGGADYIGVGAMFPTRTKKDAPLVSFDALEAIRQAVHIPIVAIGGINEKNGGRLRRMGADGIAVISAVLSRPDIAGAAAELKAAFLEGR